MDRKIIVFRFDTLSTLQCYSSEVTLRVDSAKSPLQCWKDYLALLPVDGRYRYVVRHWASKWRYIDANAYPPEIIKTIDDVINIVKEKDIPTFVCGFIPTNEKY